MSQVKSKKRTLEAAKTRKKILTTAASLFAKNGFDGVSLSQIAKKANINQSLIYHYFESKEHLWKSVKNYYLENYAADRDLKIDTDNNLKDILDKIIRTRLEFYENHPEIIRMIGWQKLEPNKNKLEGGTLFSPDNWKDSFSILKKQGKIKSEINLDMMTHFIRSLIESALSEEHPNVLNSKKNKDSYINLIIECCVQAFGSS